MKSLNPYCIGSSNHATMAQLITGVNIVLILIVLDHLIMRQPANPKGIRINGLNPYCIGSSNHASIVYTMAQLITGS